MRKRLIGYALIIGGQVSPSPAKEDWFNLVSSSFEVEKNYHTSTGPFGTGICSR